MAQVRGPQLTLTTTCQLIGAAYGCYERTQLSMHLTSGLVRYLVLDAYDFPKFVQLCTMHFQSSKSTVMFVNDQIKIFVINAHTISKSLGTSLGIVDLDHASQANRFKILNIV